MDVLLQRQGWRVCCFLILVVLTGCQSQRHERRLAAREARASESGRRSVGATAPREPAPVVARQPSRSDADAEGDSMRPAENVVRVSPPDAKGPAPDTVSASDPSDAPRAVPVSQARPPQVDGIPKPAPVATTMPSALPMPETDSMEPAKANQPHARANATESTLREIIDRALDYHARHPKYSCRVTRRERVGNKMMPEEVMEMTFRAEPRSIHYRWLDSGHEGRECLYVEGRNHGNIITLGGKADFLFSGRRLSVDPNGIMARGKSRYTITQAGLDKLTKRAENILAAQEKGDVSKGTLRYGGLAERPEFQHPVHHVIQAIPVKYDANFTHGGTRNWFFDPETGRLLLTQADDPKGPCEYYLFDRFVPNDAIGESNFDPDQLWPSTAKNKPSRNE